VIAHTPRRGPRAAAYLLGLVSVGPRCGGGMRLTPGAVVDDGWLDLLLLDPLSPAAALTRLPRLFDGRLAGDPAFHVTRCRQATIRSDPPSGVQLDGELFGTTPVTISILPGALRALDCRPAARSGGREPRVND
jgi:diacylglycerol kinase (ATP)